MTNMSNIEVSAELLADCSDDELNNTILGLERRLVILRNALAVRHGMNVKHGVTNQIVQILRSATTPMKLCDIMKKLPSGTMKQTVSSALNRSNFCVLDTNRSWRIATSSEGLS